MMKSEALKEAVQEVFGKKGRVQMDEGVFSVLLQLDTDTPAEVIAERLKEKDVAVFPLEKVEEGRAEFLLSCTNVDVKDYNEALLLIRECL